MKNFCVNTIYSITQEPQEVQRYIVPVDSSVSLKSIDGKLHFDLLATASSSTFP